MGSLIVDHAGETVFEGTGVRDEEVARMVGVDPGFDFGEPLVLFADVVAFGKVALVGSRGRVSHGRTGGSVT